jgi:hypothetical protein
MYDPLFGHQMRFWDDQTDENRRGQKHALGVGVRL